MSNFVSSISASLLAKAVVFSFFAAVGGVILLIGLWMEFKRDKQTEKEWFSDINEFWKAKRKSRRGEKWVIAGVAIEIMVAVLFATLDVWDKYEINKHEAQSDTRNLPIQAIRGYARIKIRPKEGRETQFARSLHEAWHGSEPEYSDLEMKKGETVLLIFWKSPINDPNNGVAVIGLVANVVFVGTELGQGIAVRKELPYVPNICFDFVFNNSQVENLNEVTFNELKYVQVEGLGKDEVQNPLEVIGGEITISAGEWPKTFLIPAQTNRFWRVSSFETNGAFIPAGYGLVTNAAPEQK
jgi:hypothetical protein